MINCKSLWDLKYYSHIIKAVFIVSIILSSSIASEQVITPVSFETKVLVSSWTEYHYEHTGHRRAALNPSEIIIYYTGSIYRISKYNVYLTEYYIISKYCTNTGGKESTEQTEPTKKLINDNYIESTHTGDFIIDQKYWYRFEGKLNGISYDISSYA